MEILTIQGGRPLEGTVTISGAKNGVLPLLAATAAIGGQYCLHHCPKLSDVAATEDILRHLGCKVRRTADDIEVDSTALRCAQIPRQLMQRLRSSVIFLGALLARCGSARLWLPGGCCIGARPIDLHIKALRELGAEVEQYGDEVHCRAEQLQGGRVTLAYPSVGATQNLLLVGLRCAQGLTICNAAREPEVVALAGFLRAMGMRVAGEGSETISILPGEPIRTVSFTVLPDRMEAATYLCALAACGGSLRLAHTNPAHLRPVLDLLQRAGMSISVGMDSVSAQCGTLRHVGRITTSPYPGFPTDAQAPMMAALLCAEGETVIEETVFEHRFRHVPALRRMGAEIDITGYRATIHGVLRLHGADVEATDLRGGAAMVIAALGAEGESHISQIQHISRGYAGLCEKLSGIGARISLHGEPLEDTT